MDANQVFKIIKKDAVAIYSEEDLWKKLKSEKKLTIKLGADPSAPDLHLGHSVVMRKMRLLQDAGHEAVFIIGDFTAMIGDPTGKNKARVPLTFEQTRENGRTYFEQATKILDPAKTVITYNSEWLSKMGFADVLQLAGKYTLARLMERDDFSKRWAERQPIGVHELLYPLMQGYDSVALDADIEICGADQTFNVLVGRELQRDYGKTPQAAVVFPILPGLDGVDKMSKSLGNYIGLCEPADVMFEKCMKIPDHILGDYFRLTTDINPAAAEEVIGRDIREAHFLYARTIVTMYHSKEAAAAARWRYDAVAAGGTPGDVAEISLPAGIYPLWRLVAECGLAASNGEARRLVAEGGVTVDGEKITDPAREINGSGETMIKRGKARFVRVHFS